MIRVNSTIEVMIDVKQLNKISYGGGLVVMELYLVRDVSYVV